MKPVAIIYECPKLTSYMSVKAQGRLPHILMMTSSNGNIFGVTGPLGIHPSLAVFPHKGQWRGALRFSLICASTNGWVNNRAARNLRSHRDHYDVTVMSCVISLLMRKSELLFCIYQYRICQNEIDCVDLVIFVWVEIIGPWNWGSSSSSVDNASSFQFNCQDTEK